MADFAEDFGVVVDVDVGVAVVLQDDVDVLEVVLGLQSHGLVPNMRAFLETALFDVFVMKIGDQANHFGDLVRPTRNWTQ